MRRFYLGTHRPSWLGRVSVPLFVSRRTMPKAKMPRAIAPWALDSGGFSELSMYGEWSIPVGRYIEEVARFRDEVGQLDWAAPMDWMCEPMILERTGLTVQRHQELTIDNFVTLRSALGSVIVPVIQGWDAPEYLSHVDQYARRGIDLTQEPVVGVGTICRRQDTALAEEILRSLAIGGLRLHAFGAKVTGLLKYHDALLSADSMAWSYNARRRPPIAGHTHKNCANCLQWALRWRTNLLAPITTGAAA